MELRLSNMRRAPTFNDAGYVEIEGYTFRIRSFTTDDNLKRFALGQLLTLCIGDEFVTTDTGSLLLGVQNSFRIHPHFNPPEGNGVPLNAILGVIISPKYCVFGINMERNPDSYTNDVSDKKVRAPQHAMRITDKGMPLLWIF